MRGAAMVLGACLIAGCMAGTAYADPSQSAQEPFWEAEDDGCEPVAADWSDWDSGASEAVHAAENDPWQDAWNEAVGGLSAESGVNYDGGRMETYYSSNVLYHWRTPEWWLDGEGFWRTPEGRYVVAASDMEQGTVFQGSKGECQVLDTGCAPGVTDYYTNWS